MFFSKWNIRKIGQKSNTTALDYTSFLQLFLILELTHSHASKYSFLMYEYKTLDKCLIMRFINIVGSTICDYAIVSNVYYKETLILSKELRTKWDVILVVCNLFGLKVVGNEMKGHSRSHPVITRYIQFTCNLSNQFCNIQSKLIFSTLDDLFTWLKLIRLSILKWDSYLCVWFVSIFRSVNMNMN